MTVKGMTSIRGGGAHSVSLQNSSLEKVEVAKPAGSIRLYATGSTATGTVQLVSGAVLEEGALTGEGFTDVEIGSKVKEASLKGDFNTVSTADSTTGSLTLGLSGKLAKLNWSTPGRIILADNARIAELLLSVNASGTVIQEAAASVR